LAVAGRPAKATTLKRLAGNPGKRPNEAPDAHPISDSGYAPKHLSEMARAEWRRVVPELKRLGLLTVVDRAALEAYCETYAIWRQAQDAIAVQGLTFSTPNGYIQQRPEVSIAQKALQQMRGFMVEFGMTPRARNNVKGNPLQPKISRFEEFLEQSGQVQGANG
jgi:P27 family predicted phage terminase small subunit